MIDTSCIAHARPDHTPPSSNSPLRAAHLFQNKAMLVQSAVLQCVCMEMLACILCTKLTTSLDAAPAKVATVI